MHTVCTDKQQRVRLPDAKPGQVFAYEADATGTIITLHRVKRAEPEVEVLDVDDLDPKTLAPRERGEVSNESIVRAIRADRDGQ
jgi:hypothetical protein